MIGGLLGRFLVLAGLLLGMVPAWAQSPQRVVTVNLCLDQLALRLAAPGQLVGVSSLSHDPSLSVLIDAARRVAAVRPQVESILALKPDLVVFDTHAHAATKRLLRQAGVRVLEVPWAASFEESQSLIGQMATALGREAVGESVIADMRRRRQEVAWTGTPTAMAAVLSANGATAGKGSLIDDLLRLAGLRNLAADLGIPAYGRISIETIIAHRPDFLVLDDAGNDAPSHATEFVDNRALRILAGKARTVSVPMKLSVCAGPENLDAVRLLAEARR